MNQFALVLKSTLDYEAKKLADSRGLPFVDLTSPMPDTRLLESDAVAVCWEFSTLTEAPFDPLWLCSFDIGIMTFLDPSQYQSLDLISMFQEAFKIGALFQIKDYSKDATPVQNLGSMFIIDSHVVQSQADTATELRFVAVTARVSRNVHI